MLFTEFVFVFAPIAISQVASDSCDDLDQCIIDFHSETYAWAGFNGTPTEEVWNATWKGMCDSIPQRRACLHNSSCSDQTLLRWAKKAEKFCSRNGQKFFNRIRGNDCVGNTSFAAEADRRRFSCLIESGLLNDTFKDECNPPLENFRCVSEFMNEQCGPLFRWMIDQMNIISFKLDFPNCDPPRTSQFPKN